MPKKTEINMLRVKSLLIFRIILLYERKEESKKI
jgi:hypothetical protein